MFKKIKKKLKVATPYIVGGIIGVVAVGSGYYLGVNTKND